MIQTPMEFYDEVMKVAKPEEISHWVNDLQCKVTPQTTALVEDYAFAHLITQFKSPIDGEMWYEIPFAYKPWWDTEGKEVKENETV